MATMYGHCQLRQERTNKFIKQVVAQLNMPSEQVAAYYDRKATRRTSFRVGLYGRSIYRTLPQHAIMSRHGWREAEAKKQRGGDVTILAEPAFTRRPFR
jgi:hypothetical protein